MKNHLSARSMLLAAAAVLSLGTGAAATPQDGQEAEYRVGPEDTIRVVVAGFEEMTSSLTVSRGGEVRMALAGDMYVGGLTETEIEELVTERLRQFINEPRVTVLVEAYESQSYFIFGAIANVGSYSMTGPTTLLEALVEAGGMNPEEAEGTVRIIRKAFPQQPLEIDGRELFFNGNPAYDIDISPGDMINVIPKPEYEIYIYDDRGTGGIFRFRESVTLLQAIANTGGLGEGASKDVRIVRKLDDGTTETFEVNVDDILKGEAPDIEVLPGDVIVIKRGFF